MCEMYEKHAKTHPRGWEMHFQAKIREKIQNSQIVGKDAKGMKNKPKHVPEAWKFIFGQKFVKKSKISKWLEKV